MRQLKITKSITNRESASLDKYLQEIGKEDLITVEEEVDLAQRIKKGDKEALEGIQVHFVRRMVDTPVDPSGAGRTEPDRAVAAEPGGVAEQNQQGLRPFRAGARTHALARGTGRRARSAEGESDRHAARIGPSRLGRRAFLGRGGQQSARRAGQQRFADRGLINESLGTEVERALSTLTDRERDIIKYFFGIGCSEMTLEEIGEKFGLTRERVRQIKEKAIRRLRHSTRSKLLKSYLG